MSIDNLSQLKALNLFGMAMALAEIQAEAPRCVFRFKAATHSRRMLPQIPF